MSAHADAGGGGIDVVCGRGFEVLGQKAGVAEYVKLQTAYVNFAFKGIDEFLALADTRLPAYFALEEDTLQAA